MNIKILCCLLLILLILLIILIITKKYYYENFVSNAWTTNQDVLKAESLPLNNIQKDEVKNMVTSISQSQLKTLITTQSPLLVGPQGIQGVQGPSGTKLIASGRLINKGGSFDTNRNDNNYFIPKYAVTRTEGVSPTSSLTFMDIVSPFASFQNWQLDINNNLTNRYDNTCLTMDSKNDKLFMSKCTDDPNQKWMYDNSNRIISTTASNNTLLKCIGLSKLEQNVITTNIPRCEGQECLSNTPRKYLTVKDCDINTINDDELWTFI